MRVRKQLFERVTLTGPVEDHGKASKYLIDNGLRFIRSGPMPVAKYRVDTTRFKIVAEREVERPKRKYTKKEA